MHLIPLLVPGGCLLILLSLPFLLQS